MSESAATTVRDDAKRLGLGLVLAEFVDYLNDGAAWSNEAWRTWLRVFARFGVGGETADELVANARAVLRRG